MGIKGFSGSATRKNERSSGVWPRPVVPWPFFFLPFLHLSSLKPLTLLSVDSCPRAYSSFLSILTFLSFLLISFSSILTFFFFIYPLSCLPHVTPRDSKPSCNPHLRYPMCNHPLLPFFPEFESIKNRLEQRNERPPISHWIMLGSIGPGEKANHD